MTRTLRIRRGREADLPRVMEIDAATWAVPIPEDEWREVMEDRQFRLAVAEYYGVVVGYSAYKVGRMCIHLRKLAVAPEYQGLGIGSGLVDRMVGTCHATNRAMIRLKVRTDNFRAIRLYRSRGFRVEFYEPSYYGPGLDAYIMHYYTRRARA